MAATETPTTEAPEQKPAAAPTEPQGKQTFIWGTGRRKTAVARVRIAAGTGKILINDRELNDYLTRERDRKTIFGPLEVTNTGGKLDILINASGGGATGQTGAIVLGVARALLKYDVSLEQALRNAGYLTRDPRMKERKKYGQRG